MTIVEKLRDRGFVPTYYGQVTGDHHTDNCMLLEHDRTRVYVSAADCVDGPRMPTDEGELFVYITRIDDVEGDDNDEVDVLALDNVPLTTLDHYYPAHP